MREYPSRKSGVFVRFLNKMVNEELWKKLLSAKTSI